MNRYILLLAFLLLFSSVNAQQEEFDATTAPAKTAEDAKELARYLCEGVVSDTVKARRIYQWVTHNIAYDVKGAKDPEREPSSVKGVLDNKLAVCDGYALLYTEMCKAVGLEAVRIDGYVRQWPLDDSDKLYIPRHQWCAVKVDRRWELVDPTFGAGGIKYESSWWRSTMKVFSKEELHFGKKKVFEFKYDSSYFLTDPIVLRHTHLPADPLWQLAEVHLPLKIFEYGDSAIAGFNAQNPQRINRAPELEYIARLNEREKILDYADRAYKFNDRFPTIMAIKEQIKAREALAKYASRRNIPPRRVFEDAYRGMVLAKEYLDKQQSYFTTHYSALKRKNINKNRAAKERFRDITVANKRQVAQCRRRSVSAERKKEILTGRQDKAEEYADDISYNKLDSIETINARAGSSSRLVQSLSDSIAARQSRLKKLNFNVIDKMQDITLTQESNEAAWDSLEIYNSLADTLMEKEAVARIAFLDSYDDYIQTVTYQFNKARFQHGDTQLNRYLQNIDTLMVYYEDLQKIYREQGRLYKSLLRAMEQYKRWNNKDEQMVSVYTSTARKYAESISQYQQTMEVYGNYLDKNVERLNTLVTLFEDEIAVVDKMEQAEDARKEAEDETMEEEKFVDERENEIMQQQVADMKKELTDILSK